MATDLQINANRENAQRSTGPLTEAGKAISARNALTLGLFTKTDYVRPKEQSEYNELCARCVSELMPEGVLEETLVTSIVSAAWLLRRCLKVERELARTDKLDPIRVASSHATQNSINRARSHASLLLHRSIAELRRLQTDRAIAKKLISTNDDLPALASAKPFVTAIHQHHRAQAQPHQQKLALNDKNESATRRTPRNGLCPCGSGEKFKRCCGKDAPPVLGPVSNPERKAA